jgi:hypothetical protein
MEIQSIRSKLRTEHQQIEIGYEVRSVNYRHYQDVIDTSEAVKLAFEKQDVVGICRAADTLLFAGKLEFESDYTFHHSCLDLVG